MGLHLLDQLLPLYKQIGEETCLRFQTGSVTKPRLLLSLPEGFIPAPRLLPADMDRFWQARFTCQEFLGLPMSSPKFIHRWSMATHVGWREAMAAVLNSSSDGRQEALVLAPVPSLHKHALLSPPLCCRNYPPSPSPFTEQGPVTPVWLITASCPSQTRWWPRRRWEMQLHLV